MSKEGQNEIKTFDGTIMGRNLDSFLLTSDGMKMNLDAFAEDGASITFVAMERVLSTKHCMLVDRTSFDVVLKQILSNHDSLSYIF